MATERFAEQLRLVDTHCHLDLEDYFPECEAALKRARAVGVRDFVLAGVDRRGWERMLALSSLHDGVHAAPGLHPMYLAHHAPGDLEVLASLIKSPKVVAIGEVGLDYQIESADRKAQQELFEAQIALGAASGLPLLLHVRKAHDQVLATLRRKKFPCGGIVHAYNGSQQQAMQFIGLGFMIGVCGTITYDRARKIRGVISALPLASLVLESDAPDIPPSSHWGEANQPEYLPEILEALSLLRTEGRGRIAEETTANAKKILGLT